ncbi:unnamed protein product [Lactuca saligna]|uniref:Uncharacterized protein n=1 Tax=Lactuca saligna TaxID=75948 RepID=A0AA36E7L4_LACSI|nr:unnamed protein product [Lactuca saligna]
MFVCQEANSREIEKQSSTIVQSLSARHSPPSPTGCCGAAACCCSAVLHNYNSTAIVILYSLRIRNCFLILIFIDTIMGNMKTIDSFFKRKVDNEEIHDENIEIKRHKASTSEPKPQEHENQQENDIYEATQSNPNEVDLKQLERDPAKRKQMWDYPVNLREEVIRAYMSLGPF